MTTPHTVNVVLDIGNVVEVEELLVLLILSLEHDISVVDPAACESKILLTCGQHLGEPTA